MAREQERLLHLGNTPMQQNMKYVNHSYMVSGSFMCTVCMRYNIVCTCVCVHVHMCTCTCVCVYIIIMCVCVCNR